MNTGLNLFNLMSKSFKSSLSPIDLKGDCSSLTLQQVQLTVIELKI